MSVSTTLRGREGGSDDGSGADRIPHRALILTVLAAILVAALVVWLLAFSSVFGVRTVSVHGEHTLSATRVLAAADVVDGTPLLRLDTDRIRTRVEALPDIASARVSTKFPSTVTITVTERVAVGVLQSGSDYLLVDRTGRQFRRVPARPTRLPLFVLAEGARARLTGEAVATAAAALPGTLRARIASIQALDPSAITLLLADGRVVRWGGAERSADKARVLPTLLRQRGEQFDVTDPDLPFSR